MSSQKQIHNFNTWTIHVFPFIKKLFNIFATVNSFNSALISLIWLFLRCFSLLDWIGRGIVEIIIMEKQKIRQHLQKQSCSFNQSTRRAPVSRQEYRDCVHLVHEACIGQKTQFLGWKIPSTSQVPWILKVDEITQRGQVDLIRSILERNSL